jgi:hypothetical protein
MMKTHRLDVRKVLGAILPEDWVTADFSVVSSDLRKTAWRVRGKRGRNVQERRRLMLAVVVGVRS